MSQAQHIVLHVVSSASESIRVHLSTLSPAYVNTIYTMSKLFFVTDIRLAVLVMQNLLRAKVSFHKKISSLTSA